MSSPTLGYGGVSTTQDPTLQIDALTADGGARIFVERACGARASCPHLARLLQPPAADVA